MQEGLVHLLEIDLLLQGLHHQEVGLLQQEVLVHQAEVQDLQADVLHQEEEIKN